MSRSPLLLSILKDSSIVITIALAGYFIEYILNIFLANVLTPAEYGNFSVALTWAMFWSTLAILGGNKSVLKYIPLYQQQDSLLKEAGIIRYYFYAILFMGLFIAGITTLIAYLDVKLAPDFGFDNYHSLILAIWFIPLIAALKFVAAVMRGNQRYVLSATSEHLIIWILLLAFVWTYSLHISDMSDWHAVALLGLAILAAFFIQLAIFPKAIKAITIKKPHYEIKNWMRLSLPFMFDTLIFLAFTQVSLVLVEIITPNENDVGFYAASFKSAGLIFLISRSISQIFTTIVGTVSEGAAEQQQNVYNLYMKTQFGIMLIGFIVYLIFGQNILNLFGSEYSIAYPTLLILASGYVISALSLPHLIFLQFNKHNIFVLSTSIICLLINIVLSWILIQYYGINGAATAVFISLSLLSIIRAILFKKLLHLRLLPLSSHSQSKVTI